MSAPKEFYVVWQDGEDEQYYNHYFSLKDAVASESEGAIIYKASLERLGAFKIITKLVKEKKKTAKTATAAKKVK